MLAECHRRWDESLEPSARRIAETRRREALYVEHCLAESERWDVEAR